MKHFMLAPLVVAICGCTTFQPKTAADWIGYTETGKASYYAAIHQNKKTASGERYDAGLKTAAHKQLPFGTRIKITNTSNGKSVVVKVNDRGPFVRGRIVDLSKSAFSAIGNPAAGVLDVRLEVIR